MSALPLAPARPSRLYTPLALTFSFLLRAGDAGRASSFLFLNPVIGLFLGALLLGDPLRPADFLGSAAVAAGIYLVQRSSSSIPSPSGRGLG